jgi:hypothetical protein
VRIGRILSILTTCEVKLPLFPTRSVGVTTRVIADPSVESTSGLAGLVDATPAPVSLALNETLTAVLFQPFALGIGVGAWRMRAGGVLSSTRITSLVESLISEASERAPPR